VVEHQAEGKGNEGNEELREHCSGRARSAFWYTSGVGGTQVLSATLLRQGSVHQVDRARNGRLLCEELSKQALLLLQDVDLDDMRIIRDQEHQLDILAVNIEGFVRTGLDCGVCVKGGVLEVLLVVHAICIMVNIVAVPVHLLLNKTEHDITEILRGVHVQFDEVEGSGTRALEHQRVELADP